jgi:hypothetical protein
MPSNLPFTLERLGDRWNVDNELSGSAGATLRYQRGPDRGIVTVTVKPPGGPFSVAATVLTTVIDCYNATSAEASAAITVPAASGAIPQPREFLFEVTGKNASSSGHRVVARSVDF